MMLPGNYGGAADCCLKIVIHAAVDSGDSGIISDMQQCR